MIDEQNTETATQQRDATKRWAKIRSTVRVIAVNKDVKEELAMKASIREARGSDADATLFHIFRQNMKSMQSVLAVYFATEDKPSSPQLSASLCSGANGTDCSLPQQCCSWWSLGRVRSPQC
jgi:hypothetical protein